MFLHSLPTDTLLMYLWAMNVTNSTSSQPGPQGIAPPQPGQVVLEVAQAQG